MNSYLFYAKLLEKMATSRTNYKSLILSECEARGFDSSRIKQAYSILINSYKNLQSIELILRNFQAAFPEVKISNRWLFIILLHEFFRAKGTDSQRAGLKGGGFLIRQIKSHERFFEKEISDLKVPLFTKSLIKEDVYLRIISQRSSLSSLSKEIEEKIPKTSSFKLIQDPDIKNLLSIDYPTYSTVFCSSTAISDRTDFVVQGKSSSYPAWILFKALKSRPLKRFDVIDACAAPGNKTLQLAEYLLDFPKARLFAFEKNSERFQVLASRLQKYNINMAKTRIFNQDFLSLDPGSVEFGRVGLVLLDPSCSGSGMRNHLFSDQLTEANPGSFQAECRRRFKGLDQKGRERVMKLQAFQKKALIHAMKFQKVKRIVYSTCSLFAEENEDVVGYALENNPDFGLVRIRGMVKGLRKGFGRGVGGNCLRADPFTDNTDGFFIALFKRKRKVLEI